MHHAEICTFEGDAMDVVQLILTVLLLVDLFVSFNVAIYCEEEVTAEDDSKEWIVKRSEIARVYMFGRLRPDNFVRILSDFVSDRPANIFPAGLFWIDLLAAIPFDWILGLALGCESADLDTLKTIRLLRLLRMLRLVRLCLQLMC
jgi:hypothetical protein